MNAAYDCSAPGTCVRWSKYSTVQIDWQPAGYQFCACVQCLRDWQSFASYFDLVFVLVCWISRRESSGYTFSTTAQMYVLLAYFCSDAIQSRRPIDRQARLGHRQRVYIAVFMTRVADQVFALTRGRCSACTVHAVHWCVTHYRQTVCSELSHSRHNAGDRSTKVQ